MVKHHKQFGERQIVTTLSAQLSWSRFVELIKVKDGVKRAIKEKVVTEQPPTMATQLFRCWPTDW